MDDDDVIIDPDTEGTEGESEEDIAAMEDRADVKVTKLRKELETAKKEKLENLDGWQRAKADYVNALKRFEEEKKSAVQLGIVLAAKAFLPAIDSLERAQASGELPEGFVGIAKQLESAAQTLKLVQFGAIGEKFDPMLHEALGQDPAASPEDDDHVTAILETGWKVGDSVLRPAKVRVSHFEA